MACVVTDAFALFIAGGRFHLSTLASGAVRKGSEVNHIGQRFINIATAGTIDR
jgi:hypothetical protein